MGYFLYNFAALPKCKSTKQIVKAGGSVVLNSSGSVSVYSPNGLPFPLTKPCCKRLDPTYIWDADNQECRWSVGGTSGTTCPTDSNPFNIILNPVGDDGAIFNIEDEETCILDISFDYLFNFDCDKVMNTILDINSNLTPEQIRVCEELEIKKEKLETIISIQETELLTLFTTLENTPYVVICKEIGEVGGELGGLENPFDPNSGSGSFETAPYDGDMDDNLPDPYNPNTPPTAFPIELNGTYCLTDLGLQSWETILGPVNYTTWLTSEGTNTSTYGCPEVNQLIQLDGGTGTLIGTCSVSITERQELIKTITLLQISLQQNNLALIEIIKQIEENCVGVNCNTVKEVFENLDVCITLEVVDPISLSLITVYEESLFNIGSGNLYEYLISTSGNTGFFISATTQTANSSNTCGTLGTQLVKDLVEELGPNDSEVVTVTQEVKEVVQDSFESPWLEYTTRITDPNIISQISGKKIKISLKIKECCTDFCILVDRLKLDKNCSRIDTTTLAISTCPSFDLLRVCDNKKSWLANENFKHREFDLKLRDTQYDINNYKLALNSKEVDLDINTANAIEQDVFCYIQDNPCLLDCSTSGTSSINFVTDLDFDTILSAETICCDASYTSACTVSSIWNLDVNLGCETIYSNDNFYVSSGITDVPTEAMYITELNNVATALDLTFTTGATSVTFTHTIDCDQISYLDKTLSVNLGLNITTTCS